MTRSRPGIIPNWLKKGEGFYMAEGVYRITEQFEEMLARYTGAPYAVAVDNCSSALFLALTQPE